MYGRARAISRPEFVAIVAALMAVEALAIDVMLPALPNMGDAFSVTNANDRSLVLPLFLVGFGLPQLVFGPVSDRFGRRLPIMIGLAAYIVAAFGAPVAPSFSALLWLRFIQGVGAASIRVGILSAVRDRYSGAAMAEIMSVAMSIFLVIPIVMPGAGQLILLIGPWQLIFGAMGALAVVFAVWTFIRLPETSPRRSTEQSDRSSRPSASSASPRSAAISSLRGAGCSAQTLLSPRVYEPDPCMPGCRQLAHLRHARGR